MAHPFFHYSNDTVVNGKRLYFASQNLHRQVWPLTSENTQIPKASKNGSESLYKPPRPIFSLSRRFTLWGNPTEGVIPFNPLREIYGVIYPILFPDTQEKIGAHPMRIAVFNGLCPARRLPSLLGVLPRQTAPHSSRALPARKAPNLNGGAPQPTASPQARELLINPCLRTGIN